MVPDSAIQQMAGQMPPEALQVFKKLVSAMEQQADKPASDTSGAASGSSKKSLKGINRIGNSDEASLMTRAIFMWDEEMTKKALGELFLGQQNQESSREGQWCYVGHGAGGMG